MNPRLVAPLVAALVAAILSVGGCSSSDATTTPTTGSSASTTSPGSTAATGATVSTTSVPPSTAAATSAPPKVTAEANDLDIARGALITLSLFPGDWIEDPVRDEDDDPDTDEFEADFDACLGRDDQSRVRDDIEQLEVRTGDFHPADDATTTVSHEVVLAPDVDTARAAMDEVRIDGAEPCLANVIGNFYRTELAADPDLADVTIGDDVVTRAEEGREADEAVGVLLEVPLTIGDQTVSQFLELLYQRQGRALSELSFSSFGARFDRDRHTALGDEVARRLAAIGD